MTRRPTLMTVVGARPQFIKAAPVSRAWRRVGSEILVHTGQHYDEAMSGRFFAELGLPQPDVSLGVGSGPHGAQTARMLEALERTMADGVPDVVLVYGDTNSTMAAALAAAKLQIPVAHVEAGLRSFDRAMPEEVNRVVTDHLARWHFCPSEASRRQLAAEGIMRDVYVVGDVMLDAVRDAARRGMPGPDVLGEVPAPGTYVVATVHRAANTDDPARLRAILDGLGRIGRPVLLPLHPRTRAAIDRAGLVIPAAIRLLPPLGHGDMAALVTHAACCCTDSGGLQKEAYWLGVPCVTMRDETEWTETVAEGWNVLVGADADAIARAARAAKPGIGPRDAYGAAGASERIVRVLAAALAGTPAGEEAA